MSSAHGAKASLAPSASRSRSRGSVNLTPTMPGEEPDRTGSADGGRLPPEWLELGRRRRPDPGRAMRAAPVRSLAGAGSKGRGDAAANARGTADVGRRSDDVRACSAVGTDDGW